MKNVIVRSLSGVVYIAAFVACILLGDYWFMCLTLCLTILGINEYMQLVAARIGERVGKLSFSIALISALCFSIWPFVYNCEEPITSITVTALCFLTPVILLSHAVASKTPNAVTMAAQSLLGVVYVAIPMLLLNIVYLMWPFGSKLILISLICIWINDTGAFCVGSLFGKHRLCERLSPKKSWEGFWGGLGFVVVAMIVYAAVDHHNMKIYVFYGVVISILSTIGDLFESLLKRSAGVKDSGKLIPGHGGILDRIDSFLFVAYAIFFMAIIESLFLWQRPVYMCLE